MGGLIFLEKSDVAAAVAVLHFEPAYWCPGEDSNLHASRR